MVPIELEETRPGLDLRALFSADALGLGVEMPWVWGWVLGRSRRFKVEDVGFGVRGFQAYGLGFGV